MNNEIKYEKKNSKIILTCRDKIELSGVIKIENLNKDTFLVDTVNGKVLVEGSDLEMNKLQLEQGELTIIGKIDSIIYDDKVSKEKKKESFFTKLFK